MAPVLTPSPRRRRSRMRTSRSTGTRTSGCPPRPPKRPRATRAAVVLALSDVNLEPRPLP
jgi:hypothetical protein